VKWQRFESVRFKTRTNEERGKDIMLRKQTVALFFVGLLLASGLASSRLSWAIDVGDKAPDFTLPSTDGVDISLSDFKGKRFVFLEFYSADFVPA
jgi:hypothetical protein